MIIVQINFGVKRYHYDYCSDQLWCKTPRAVSLDLHKYVIIMITVSLDLHKYVIIMITVSLDLHKYVIIMITVQINFGYFLH